MNGSVGSLFDSGAMPVIEEAMRFAEARHQLILSNVANADTPGYRRVDLDENEFRKTLGRAIRARDTRHPGTFEMGKTVRAMESPAAGFPRFPSFDSAAAASHAGPLRHDENDVSPEREMSLLARNAEEYAGYAALLHKSYGMLLTAITERA